MCSGAGTGGLTRALVPMLYGSVLPTPMICYVATDVTPAFGPSLLESVPFPQVNFQVPAASLKHALYVGIGFARIHSLVLWPVWPPRTIKCSIDSLSLMYSGNCGQFLLRPHLWIFSCGYFWHRTFARHRIFQNRVCKRDPGHDSIKPHE
jgi:hypothetical protein